MTEPILLVDDDRRLAEMMTSYLAGHGFSVEVRLDVASGWAAAQAGGWAALVLDVMLPDGDGFELCRRIRGLPAAAGQVPILMLTARGDDTDRVVGLELGADDYLSKPFNPRELAARLKALVRRSRWQGARPDEADVMRFGRLEIDRAQRVVRRDGEATRLTGYQFDLLVALAERAGRVLSREQLVEIVRGEELEAFDRSVDVHVSRIRAVIEDDPKQPRVLQTVRGVGYVFGPHGLTDEAPGDPGGVR